MFKNENRTLFMTDEMEHSTSLDIEKEEKKNEEKQDSEEKNSFNDNETANEDDFSSFVPDDVSENDDDQGDPVMALESSYIPEKRCTELLKPKFSNTNLTALRVLRKGASKSNPSKGKGRYQGPDIFDYFIDKDLLKEGNMNSKVLKRFQEFAEQSRKIEKIEKTKKTIVSRISDLDQKNLLSLTDFVYLFLNNKVPISMKVPFLFSSYQISTLLVVEQSSQTTKIVSQNLDLQDLLRREILQAKKLPVCACGYIYVHPSLTYSRHPENPSKLIGRIFEDNDVVSESKVSIMSKLNSLRFFLEILFEYHCFEEK